MSESLTTTCPTCGARITGGECPRCLMAQIVEPTQVGDPVASAHPLTAEELAPHFPQLEILSCLGRGGMGVVYKARQKSLNRLVAIKLLAPERADDPQFATRFEKEAQALAALSHPNIVAVHDFGHVAVASHAQLYYLIMEFVDGVNLRQLLQTKRLTPKEALSIVPPVCDALQCAHDHGIVHRDIKPENLLIDKNGIVKIADFGIAKMLSVTRLGEAAVAGVCDPGGLGQPTKPNAANEFSGSGVTDPGYNLATPAYAAPEQSQGTADHRADIYSLGVVLYEMLTGERPKHDLVPPSKRVQVDVRIDEIVLRALEAKPELRFATATEFRTQVEAAANNPQTPRFARLKMPALVFATIYGCFLIFVLLTRESLPARVAMHFNMNGRADSWSSRDGHCLLMGLLPLGLFGLMAALITFFWQFPSVLRFNGVNADIWNQPAHRPEALMKLARALLFLVSILTLFFARLHWEVVQAHLQHPPALPPSALLFPVIWVFALVIVWVVNITESFAEKPGQTRSLSSLKPKHLLIVGAVLGAQMVFEGQWARRLTPSASSVPKDLSTKSIVTAEDTRLPLMRSVQSKLDAFHRDQPDNRAVVKVVYFHAADREPLSDYAARVERIATDVSAFYREGLAKLGVNSNGIPFERDSFGKIKLRLVRGAQPSGHYTFESGDETWSEVQRALPRDLDAAKDHVLILYGLCDTARDGRYIFHAPYYGAGGSNHQHGLCHAADCELLDPENLTSPRPMVFSEHYYPRKEMTAGEFNSWYLGGLAHELGHGLGLPHDNGSPLEDKLGVSLMGMGNFNYREHLRGGKQPAYLSLASAIRLATKPFITRSDKARWEPVKLGAYVVEARQAGYDLRLNGRVTADVPVCAMIATIWPAVKDSTDHQALTFCSVVDDKGAFDLRVGPPGPVDCHLKLSIVLANGAEPSITTKLRFDGQGKMRTDDLTLDLQASMVELLLASDPEQAKPMLTDEAISQVKTDEARRRLKQLQRLTQPEPEPVDLSTTTSTSIVLSDAQWSKAEVGWGTVVRNRWGAPSDYEQGLLLKLGGKVFEKGLYAHASSRFEFATNARWQTFTATAAMRDGAPDFGSVVFIVEGDGVELARSRFLKSGESEPLRVKIEGVKTLTLRAEGTEGNNHGCWSIWCDPIVERHQP